MHGFLCVAQNQAKHSMCAPCDTISVFLKPIFRSCSKALLFFGAGLRNTDTLWCHSQALLLLYPIMQDCSTHGRVSSAGCYLTGQKYDSVSFIQFSEIVEGARNWDMDDPRLGSVQTLPPQQWPQITPGALKVFWPGLWAETPAVSDYHVDQCRLL